MGRFCMPILNDSGATCSLLTEEQVVLLINHIMKMLEEGKINYPIVQFFHFRESPYMRGAEKDGIIAVEFAILARVSSFPLAAKEGPSRISSLRFSRREPAGSLQMFWDGRIWISRSLRDEKD